MTLDAIAESAFTAACIIGLIDFSMTVTVDVEVGLALELILVLGIFVTVIFHFLFLDATMGSDSILLQKSFGESTTTD
jgi:hypothetical protein